MKLKITTPGLVAIALVGCASAPMSHDAQRTHAERLCRFQAVKALTYTIDDNGVSRRNVAYERCMARHGFVAAEQ